MATKRLGVTTQIVVSEIVRASVDPTADDNARAGYGLGTLWLNITAHRAWFYEGESEESATWVRHALYTDVAALAASIPLNTTAARAPTSSDDSTAGHSAFSRWIDSTGPDTYECTDATPDAAVWVPTYTAP